MNRETEPLSQFASLRENARESGSITRRTLGAGATTVKAAIAVPRSCIYSSSRGENDDSEGVEIVGRRVEL